MPAPRLPWYRFWGGATAHAKARELSDGEFRTWIELLDLSSQQKWRGRFTNRKAALGLVRRPSAHLATLVRVGLIDEDAGDKHLTMHDWDDWQRWRKEDANDTGTPNDLPPERPPNGHLIDTGSPADWPTDEHTPSSREEERVKRRELREENVEEETIEDRSPSLRSGGAALEKTNLHAFKPLGNPRVTALVEAFRAYGEPEPAMSGRDVAAIKSSTAAPESIVDAYLAVKNGEYGDGFMQKRLSIHEAVDWVNGFEAWKAAELRREVRGGQPRWVQREVNGKREWVEVSA